MDENILEQPFSNNTECVMKLRLLSVRLYIRGEMNAPHNVESREKSLQAYYER